MLNACLSLFVRFHAEQYWLCVCVCDRARQRERERERERERDATQFVGLFIQKTTRQLTSIFSGYIPSLLLASSFAIINIGCTSSSSGQITSMVNNSGCFVGRETKKEKNVSLSWSVHQRTPSKQANKYKRKGFLQGQHAIHRERDTENSTYVFFSC